MNEAEIAVRTLRALPQVVLTNPELRAHIPADATPEHHIAYGAGTAARYVADMLAATIPTTHPTFLVVMEYLSLSMATICQFAKADPEIVSKTADAIAGTITSGPGPEVANTPPSTDTPQ